MKELNQKKTKINWEISAFEIVENENHFLHKQLDLLSIDFHNDTLSRSAEMESSKQRSFDARMTMELVLRKELQALDLNFKQRAVCRHSTLSCSASDCLFRSPILKKRRALPRQRIKSCHQNYLAVKSSPQI
jgi:hypothetical protein